MASMLANRNPVMMAQRKPAARQGLGLVRRVCPVLRTPQRGAVKAASAFTGVSTEMSDAERAALAEKVGFRSVAKELPDGVNLMDIIKTLPPEVFELDHSKAWRAVLVSIVAMSISMYLVHIAPWFLLPAAWALAGTALTGFFVIGHECGHRSFHENNLVEDIVGTLAFMPIIYPFEPWRIKHNHHHAHTNKLEEDTAWHPVQEHKMEQWDATSNFVFKTFLGTPLKLWASVGHWWIWHFDLNKYTEKQRPRVMVSLAAVALFAFVALPALTYYTGFWGLVKYWVMPWLGYHFWMSTFTVVHHTAPHIPFKPAKEWNAAKAQLSGTVHCDYPAWVEFLTHDISWHVPHHVNSRIPYYNLRKATESLRENWGEYMTECTFNWRMLKNICTECHVYDKETNYKPFDWKKEELMFAIQRRILPNGM